MATFEKFYCFVRDIGQAKHDMVNGQHDLRLMLTNDTPDQANDANKTDLTEITQANGYNNISLNQNWTLSTNIAVLSAPADITWTANGGNFGPFQYVVMYNDNDANKALIGYWDYGSSINCNNGETFTFDVPANGTIANLT